MKIVYTSDLHGNKKRYLAIKDLAEKVKADIIILGGDLFAITIRR